MEATITRWSVPEGEPWKLKITVSIQPFDVDEAYYRVHEYEEGNGHTRLHKDEWKWFRWSMAGKPTVRVDAECAGVLNRMVMDHPDLSRLLHLFGYSHGDASPIGGTSSPSPNEGGSA